MTALLVSVRDTGSGSLKPRRETAKSPGESCLECIATQNGQQPRSWGAGRYGRGIMALARASVWAAHSDRVGL